MAIRIVAVTFNDSSRGRYHGTSSRDKHYHYKTDLDLQIGDECVVDSPYGGTAVVTVRSLDPVGGIRNATKWIVAKVDRERYLAREKAIEQLKDCHARLEAAVQDAIVVERRRQLAERYPTVAGLIAEVEAIEAQLATLGVA